jgi:hypothetical protein
MDDGQDIGTCLKEGSPSELEVDEEMEMDEGSAGEEEEEEVGDSASVPSPEQEVALSHGSSGQAEASGLNCFSCLRRNIENYILIFNGHLFPN